MEQQQQWHSSKNIVWLINPRNPTDEEFMDMLDTRDNQNNNKILKDESVGGASGGGCAHGDSFSTTPSDEWRRLAIQRSLQSLTHASQCRDINCRITSCHKMKRVLQHIKRCKCRSNKEEAQLNPGCPLCKELIFSCCCPTKQCIENKCPVPHCVNIKFKLKQQLFKWLQKIQILNRRSPLMTSISQQSSHHDYRPSPQELVTHPQQQSQPNQINNLYVKCKPVHNFQQQQILERHIALMASLSNHSSQPQKTPQLHYMKPATATPLPTDASGFQEVVARDQQQPQRTQMNNLYVKSETVHHLQRQQESQQSPTPTINCNQQQMYSNVTPQRYRTQNESEEKPQSVPFARSAPQQTLTYPAFQTQRPPIPSDILLSQQQPDFGAQQHQRQELTPEDQLTIIIENL
jgi:E1A/CREB-binding protein